MLELMLDFKRSTQRLLAMLTLDADKRQYTQPMSVAAEARNIKHCMQSFASVSRFVFKILHKLNQTRVSHIIHHLSLQLDFNHYYNDATGRARR